MQTITFQIWYLNYRIFTSIGQSLHMRVTRFNPFGFPFVYITNIKNRFRKKKCVTAHCKTFTTATKHIILHIMLDRAKICCEVAIIGHTSGDIHNLQSNILKNLSRPASECRILLSCFIFYYYIRRFLQFLL